MESVLSFGYDSANRLIKVGYHSYTYNAEDVRIRDFCCGNGTIYTYNTNCELSQLLMKTTGTTVTKYVYGCGLIGEETGGSFKTYHFDYRGSTVAITDAGGNVTDTFEYDTYGKLTGRTGTSEVIFGYNGRDGVVTDDNGLIYMRARYYSPDMKRFVNADVIAGDISNAITFNRYAYANGNPVSLVDPLGLAAWWENALKITAGVAVIVAAAVVAVATAGTAVAVVAGVAATGAAVSGTVGAAIGYHDDGIDGAANGFLVGSVSGAASGALGALPVSRQVLAVGNAVINVGELYLEDVVEDGEVNEVSGGDVIYTVVSGYINFDRKGGLLSEGNEMYDAMKRRNRKIARVANENTKYARKVVRRAIAEYNDAYEDALWKYAGDTLKDEGKGLVADWAYNTGKDLGEYVAENFIRSK